MNHPCCFAPFFFPRPGAKETLQTLDVIRLPHRCGRLAVGPVVWQLVLDAAFVVSKFVEANGGQMSSVDTTAVVVLIFLAGS